MVDIYKILRRQRYELGGFSGVNMAEMAGNTANGLNQAKIGMQKLNEIALNLNSIV